jgi:hypothetical protein
MAVTDAGSAELDAWWRHAPAGAAPPAFPPPGEGTKTLRHLHPTGLWRWQLCRPAADQLPGGARQSQTAAPQRCPGAGENLKVLFGKLTVFADRHRL